MGIVADYGGLAYDTGNNTMYLVDGYQNDVTYGNSSLYSVNLTTGQATLIGSTGYTGVFGLTYDPVNNTLYAGIFQGGGILTLNLSTGAGSLLSGSTGTIGDAEQLAYDTSNGTLYAWSDCLSCAALYSINPSTGAGTLLSDTSLNSNNSGLVYDPVTNLLYDLDVRGILSTINTSTYVQTDIGTEDVEMSGLAEVPSSTSTTPEPSAMLLAASSCGALLWAARRRQR